MVNKFYVYAHYKPNTIEPFYIGKGCRNRATCKRDRSKHWYHIVAKYSFSAIILECGLSEEEALDLEANYIACYGRIDLQEGSLINLTDGYDGLVGISPKTRALWSSQRKGRPAWNKGKKFSIESRKKMSIAATGRQGYWTGKKRSPVSEETRKRLSESLKKSYASGRRKKCHN